MKKRILTLSIVSMVVMGLTSVTTTDQQPKPIKTNSSKSKTNFEKDKPNILFIAVDDMNDWVGYLNGHEGMKIHTPNIDKLARNSMVFTNAHTPSPACAPARAAILSGVHHARSGIQNTHWGDGPKWRKFPQLKNVETLEQFFKYRGYKTLGAGKIY
ncbi:MAG: sulfatase-like hydrolase/transferase, partial [Flavobacteriaceae bacterium]